MIRRGNGWAAFWALAMVLIVAGSGLAVWHFNGNSSASREADAKAMTSAPPRLNRGSDYYLYVKLIELADRAPNGSVWDRVDSSGPDIAFQLIWHKNVIWESAVKKDTLIGSWDLMKVDLKAIVMSGGQAELEGALIAPLVHYDPGETVDLLVWDADAVGSYDTAGKVLLKLDELGPGETALAFNGGSAKSVKRVVLQMIDRKTPVPELIKTMSNR
jgi:hypothetical protein